MPLKKRKKLFSRRKPFSHSRHCCSRHVRGGWLRHHYLPPRNTHEGSCSKKKKNQPPRSKALFEEDDSEVGRSRCLTSSDVYASTSAASIWSLPTIAHDKYGSWKVTAAVHLWVPKIASTLFVYDISNYLLNTRHNVTCFWSRKNKSKHKMCHRLYCSGSGHYLLILSSIWWHLISLQNRLLPFRTAELCNITSWWLPSDM